MIECGRYHRLMTMITEPVLEVDLSTAAAMFRSLGDVSRLEIVRHLMLGEHRVVELTEHLGLAQSTVSAHLSCLRDCGMVQVRTQGRASIYTLNAERETLEVLAAIERLLAATGELVALCPKYGKGA